MLSKKGLDETHAYCVQNVYEVIEDTTNTRLLKIKNPVGHS